MFNKVGVFLFSILFTAGITYPGKSMAQPANTDTASFFQKDSSKQIPASIDPKTGFKDLFLSSESGEISTSSLNPMAISFVEDYMEKFGKTMEEMKGWGKPYFDMMDAVLVQHNLPKELKYLAVIESHLKTNARSWAGAVGPWQFMPATARNMGLKVSRNVDERRDLYKSTHAASRYLTSLFTMYGDWLLVIAAYNGGPGNVNAAIRKSGSRDFWSLQNFLPAESRNHVKKFIATHYMMEGEGGITTLTKAEAGSMQTGSTPANRQELSGAVTQPISGRYNAQVIVKHITMDIAAFHKINPNFDQSIATHGKYDLRLPSEKMELFLAKKTTILSESVQLLLNPENTLQTASSK